MLNRIQKSNYFYFLIFVLLLRPARSTLKVVSIKQVYQAKATSGSYDNEIKLFTEKYQKLERDSARLQTRLIPNLNLHLSSFGKQNCLILMDNYFGIDLDYHSQSPMLIRKLIPGFLLSSRDSLESKGISERQWVPDMSMFHLNSTSTFVEYNFDCGESGLQETGCHFTHDLICFASGSKPWNCIIQLSLFTPDDTMLEYPKIFRYDKALALLKTTLPPSMSPVHIAYLEETTFQGLQIKLTWMWKHILHTHGDDPDVKPLVSYDVVLYSFAAIDSSLKASCLFDPSSSAGIPQDNLQYVTNGQSNPEGASLCPITKLPIRSNYPFMKEDQTLHAFNRYLRYCENSIPNLLFHKDLSIVTSPPDNVAYVHVHLWGNILGNHSYRLDDTTVCENHKIVTSVQPLDYWEHQSKLLLLEGSPYSGFVPQQFAFYFEDKISSLRFISCGKSQQEKLAFHELVSVFDKFTWLFITLSSIGFIIYFKCTSKDTDHGIFSFSIGRYLESIVRMYLEQADVK